MYLLYIFFSQMQNQNVQMALVILTDATHVDVI